MRAHVAVELGDWVRGMSMADRDYGGWRQMRAVPGGRGGFRGREEVSPCREGGLLCRATVLPPRMRLFPSRRKVLLSRRNVRLSRMKVILGCPAGSSVAEEVSFATDEGFSVAGEHFLPLEKTCIRDGKRLICDG